MKYLVIDDENQLYKIMYSDIFKTEKYDVEEIEKFNTMPSWMKLINRIHFNDRIGRHCKVPFKNIWNSRYTLSSYNFDKNEQYWIIFLNGTIRNYYTKRYLLQLKERNDNIKLAMIMYDSFSNRSAARAVSFIPVFDVVLSFDREDCNQHGLEHIYGTFSSPDFLYKDSSYYSSAFFIGSGDSRLTLMQRVFHSICKYVENCKFYIVGVKPRYRKYTDDISYTETIEYDKVLMYSYNTNCIVEVLKPGQTGISLRTCEAMAFNKKLLTNNTSLKDMPFYDERYMKIYSNEDDIDYKFITAKCEVHYKQSDLFSPLHILERLESIS